MLKKYNVVFCGTPDFSIPALELLANHPSINLLHVITMPDRPAGRGHQLQAPPVATFAKSLKVSLIQTENINKEDAILDRLENESIDFFIVLAFAQFLGSRVLNLPKMGCFNIHTSLLPKYRGAAPIQYALLNGDTGTGVSIQKMVKKMDAGDLVKESPISISFNETGGQLFTRLKFQAANTLNDLIEDIINDKVITRSQDETHVSFAPTLKKEDGHILFSNSTAHEIHNRVRALKPWPGTYCFINSKRTKILDIMLTDIGNIPAGTIKIQGDKIFIGTKDKAISLLHLQLEGKKACVAKDFINGLKGEFSLTLS